MTGLLPGALVLTVSDGVIAGTRPDKSGPVLAELLEAAGFQVERAAVRDDRDAIATAVRAAALANRSRLSCRCSPTRWRRWPTTPAATRRQGGRTGRRTGAGDRAPRAGPALPARAPRLRRRRADLRAGDGAPPAGLRRCPALHRR